MSVVLVVWNFTGCESSDKTTTETTTKESATPFSKNKESNSIFSKDSFGHGYFKCAYPVTIQLLGIGNENEKSFEVIGYETNYSGVTMFYLENRERKIVHRDYKIVDDK